MFLCYYFAVVLTHLIVLFFRASFLDENDIALVPLNRTKSRANSLHHSHQHIFQQQSSVSSNTSVQTVIHRSIESDHQPSASNGNGTAGHCSNITTASNNQMILLGASSSPASFQSANGTITTHPLNANGSMGKRCMQHNIISYQQIS